MIAFSTLLSRVWFAYCLNWIRVRCRWCFNVYSIDRLFVSSSSHWTVVPILLSLRQYSSLVVFVLRVARPSIFYRNQPVDVCGLFFHSHESLWTIELIGSLSTVVYCITRCGVLVPFVIDSVPDFRFPSCMRICIHCVQWQFWLTKWPFFSLLIQYHCHHSSLHDHVCLVSLYAFGIWKVLTSHLIAFCTHSSSLSTIRVSVEIYQSSISNWCFYYSLESLDCYWFLIPQPTSFWSTVGLCFDFIS